MDHPQPLGSQVTRFPPCLPTDCTSSGWGQGLGPISLGLRSECAASRSQIVLHSLGQRCLSASRAQTVAQLKDTEPQASGLGDRQWLYQTCTEFGFCE